MSSKSSPDDRTFGEKLGLLYKRWVLDCVPRLAHEVSLDFSRRPELYKAIDAPTAARLTDIQGYYGYAPNYPNSELRAMLLGPLFGSSDGQDKAKMESSFHMARMPVFAAVAGFAENAQPTAFPMHRERIRSALVPFKRFLEDLQGEAFNRTNDRISSLFTASESVVRNMGVAAVFGVNELIPVGWPLTDSDPAGAKLIEKISTQLAGVTDGVITRDKFVRLQRVAEKGNISISGLFGFDPHRDVDDDSIDPLTGHFYAWGSDLKLIGGARPQ